MYLCELSVYTFEDGIADLTQHLLRDSYDRCLNLLHKIKGSLKPNEYFEIYCDETLETFYNNIGKNLKDLKKFKEKDDFENYGKELFCQYAYKRESLSVAVENMLPQQVQKLAFGAMLADYSFDKYLNKRADEYSKLESISFCSN